jgi:hypothetical protein
MSPSQSDGLKMHTSPVVVHGGEGFCTFCTAAQRVTGKGLMLEINRTHRQDARGILRAEIDYVAYACILCGALKTTYRYMQFSSAAGETKS